jgi:hypothetical protein
MEEKWRPIWFSTKYSVSNTGKVKNAHTGIVLQTRKNFYEEKVSIPKALDPKNRLIYNVPVHLLIFYSFPEHFTTEGDLLVHIDGNPHNNNLDNLAIYK